MKHFVYILKSLKDSKYYIGVTKDLEKRFNEHDSGYSKSTKSRRPFRLAYKEEFENIREAYKREKYLKSLKNRVHLEKIINN